MEHNFRAIAEALQANLVDQDGGMTIVDAVKDAAAGLTRVARAITPCHADGKDASGGTVGSLTEAVMGITAGLFAIAESIGHLADVVEPK